MDSPSDKIDRPIQPREKELEVEHPKRVWMEPDHAEYPLDKLRRYYLDYLKGRGAHTSNETVRKYNNSVLSLIRFLERADEPITLGSVTPHNINRWVTDQRQKELSEHGIASRLSAVKSFTRKYVYQYLEMTTVDLLEKVSRITPPNKPFDKLTEEEMHAMLECYNRGTFEDIRNKALIACYLGTGRRYKEILGLKVDELNLMSGEIVVLAKGGELQMARLSPTVLKLVKRYFRERPKGPQEVWLTETGEPLKYWGAYGIFRRLKERSGVGRLHPHLLRHTFAQVALEKGAERAAVQDMLGHKTDTMSRRYAGNVRQQTAAKLMPNFSPL